MRLRLLLPSAASPQRCFSPTLFGSAPKEPGEKPTDRSVVARRSRPGANCSIGGTAGRPWVFELSPLVRPLVLELVLGHRPSPASVLMPVHLSPSLSRLSLNGLFYASSFSLSSCALFPTYIQVIQREFQTRTRTLPLIRLHHSSLGDHTFLCTSFQGTSEQAYS